MIWIHTYKIGKKINTSVHYDEQDAKASLQVLGGSLVAYVEVGE